MGEQTLVRGIDSEDDEVRSNIYVVLLSGFVSVEHLLVFCLCAYRGSTVMNVDERQIICSREVRAENPFKSWVSYKRRCYFLCHLKTRIVGTLAGTLASRAGWCVEGEW